MDITTHGDQDNATASIIVGSEVWSINIDKALSDAQSTDADVLARDMLALRLVIEGIMKPEDWMPSFEGENLDKVELEDILCARVQIVGTCETSTVGHWTGDPQRDEEVTQYIERVQIVEDLLLVRTPIQSTDIAA